MTLNVDQNIFFSAYNLNGKKLSRFTENIGSSRKMLIILLIACVSNTIAVQ